MQPKDQYEVLIIGAGPAGLSAALTLGRIMRTALVCDDNRPRNAPSAHLNNFPTRDGIHPAQWRQEARRDLEKYSTIEFFDGAVESVVKTDEGRFQAQLSSGTVVEFKKVLLAHGVQDKLPALPGFSELWGKSVFHCPFCHGYEVHGGSIGLVANGELALHLVSLLSGLSKDLILFTNGKAELKEDQLAMLHRNRIEVVETPIHHLAHEGEALQAVVLEDGRSLPREALFVAPTLPFTLKSPLGSTLGCEKTEHGLYKVNEMNETSVKGVFAAGDNMGRMQSVLHACGHGSMAGAAIASSLLHEALSKVE